MLLINIFLKYRPPTTNKEFENLKKMKKKRQKKQNMKKNIQDY